MKYKFKIFFLTHPFSFFIFQVVKQLWKHIRDNNLQDPKNKRIIICDEPLRALFYVDSIDMFQMNKALTKHIWPLNDEAGISIKNYPLLFKIMAKLSKLMLLYCVCLAKIAFHYLAFLDSFYNFYSLTSTCSN